MADAVLAVFRRGGVGYDTRVIYFRSDFGSARWVCLGRLVLPDLVFSFSTLFYFDDVFCCMLVWCVASGFVERMTYVYNVYWRGSLPCVSMWSVFMISF